MKTKSIIDFVGNTPLIEVQHIFKKKGVTLLLKLEGNNPGGSVKDRAAYNMISEAIKRKNIKKERKIAENFGGTFHQFTGDEITHEHWEAFWSFYIDTGARKWGTPYLTREFFNYAHEMLRNDIVLFLCQKNGKWLFWGRPLSFSTFEYGFLHNFLRPIQWS